MKVLSFIDKAFVKVFFNTSKLLLEVQLLSFASFVQLFQNLYLFH